MTQEQRHALLGVSKSTFSDWRKPDNPKHNLYLLLKNMKYNETVKLIEKAKTKETSQDNTQKKN